MKVNRLVSAILRGNWLIDPRAADGYMPMVVQLLEGKPVSFFDDDESADDGFIEAAYISPDGMISRIQRSADTGSNIFESAPVGSVAIIPISGTIMKDDYCGSPGTTSMAGWLKDARDSENISSTLLHINSGGGSVEGTGEFASLIKEIDQIKPVVAYTDGLMASAAYWIGCSAREIVASYETVEIGSIGTAIRFMDYSKSNEARGVKEHYINASASIDKNQDYYQALQGNYEAIRENVLDPTNEVFLSAVKANREGKLQLTDVTGSDKQTYQEPLTGKVYLAKKAIEIGLIDRIGSFESALESAFSHSQNPSKSASNTINNNMIKFGNSFRKLSSLKDKKAEDVSAETLNELNQELEANGITTVTMATTAILEQAEANDTAITAGLSLANKALGSDAKHATLEAAITALIADRDAQAAKADEYGDQPGEKPSKAVTTAKSEGGESLTAEANKYETSIDRELAELNKLGNI